jgi:predicted nucleic acid-binding protein
MARIYVETSIASFYYEVRSEPDMVARRDWTRRWFDAALIGTDELVTSPATLAELQSGDYPSKNDAVKLFDQLPLLSLDNAVIDIVDAYLARKLMPLDPEGDALHLAVASYHRCDFLVTWNCKHLANANKFGQIERVNAILGIGNPRLVTPLELLGENPTHA